MRIFEPIYSHKSHDSSHNYDKHFIYNSLYLKNSLRSIGKRRLAVEKYFGVKKEKAAVRTIASHIKNMIDGIF